jgi:hypothetical protein
MMVGATDATTMALISLPSLSDVGFGRRQTFTNPLRFTHINELVLK